MENMITFEEYEMGTYTITGSEKQIKWANDILNEGLNYIDTELSFFYSDYAEYWSKRNVNVAEKSEEDRAYYEKLYNKDVEERAVPLRVYRKMMMFAKNNVLSGYADESDNVPASLIIENRNKIARRLSFSKDFLHMTKKEMKEKGKIESKMPDGRIIKFF